MAHQDRSIRRVVLVGITTVIFAACSGSGSAASPTAVASATAVPLPVGVAFTNEGPLGAATAADPGVAGTYQSHAFKPAVRITVPEGWSGGALIRTFVGSSETRDGMPLTNGEGGLVLTVPTSVEPPAPADRGAPVPADLFGWIQANPNLDLGPAAEVTIGGIEGMAVEGTLSATADISAEEGAYRMVDFLPLLPRERFRLAVISVDGQQLIVATIANTADFGAFSAAADMIIDTVDFAAR
jgi:hypothetical protein